MRALHAEFGVDLPSRLRCEATIKRACEIIRAWKMEG